MSELSPEIRVKRLRVRAWRRGLRELDLLMGPFADAEGDALTEDDLSDFERLLDAPDQLVFAWLIGTAPPHPDFDTPLFRRLRTFHTRER